MRAVWTLSSDGPSSPTNLRKTFRKKQQKEVPDFSFLRRCFKNSSVFYEHIFVFLLIINEWMNARKSAARGPHFQYKKKQYVLTSESLSIKERYGTPLPIIGMFYVIYLSKWDIFGNEKSRIISFGKSSACAGCSSDCVSFSLSPVAPVNQMLSS